MLSALCGAGAVILINGGWLARSGALDLNPIEMVFAKFKELLRQAQTRTVDALWEFIGRTLSLFTPEECANYIRHCGYDPL